MERARRYEEKVSTKKDPLVEAEALELLMEKDRELIVNGLIALAVQLESQSEHFPDVVIFPDVAARPFVYAVKPIIDKRADQLGKPRPKYRFVVPTSGDDGRWAQCNVDVPEDELVEREVRGLRAELEDFRAQVELLPLSLPTLRSLGMSEVWDDDVDKFIALRKGHVHEEEEKIRSAHRGARALLERSREVLSEISSSEEELHILAVDDYLNTGSTLEQLRFAFEDPANYPRTVDLYYFPFYKNSDVEISPYSADRVLWTNEGAVEDFPSFTFARMYGFSDRDVQKEQNRRNIGVTKAVGQSRVAENRSDEEHEKGWWLRRAMAKLGEQVARRI